MGKGNLEWKDFEALVERLQQAFHPHATIVRNDHLMGQDSGRSREIDISIRYKLGTTSLLLIVDCKRHARKIDLPEFHAFEGLMKDVKAHAGIMVCEKGFSKPVKRAAKRQNVELFKFQDTENPLWQVKIRIPVSVDQWLLTPLMLNVIHADGTIQRLKSDQEVDLIDIKTGKNTSVGNLLVECWKQHPDKKDGPVAWEFSMQPDDVNSPQKFQIGLNAERQRFTRWAYLSLVGLKNVADGLTYTDKFEIKTNDQPPVLHLTDENLLPLGDYPFGVVIKTNVLKSIPLGKIGFDLKKNIIGISITGKPTKPLTLRLPTDAD